MTTDELFVKIVLPDIIVSIQYSEPEPDENFSFYSSWVSYLNLVLEIFMINSFIFDRSARIMINCNSFPMSYKNISYVFICGQNILVKNCVNTDNFDTIGKLKICQSIAESKIVKKTNLIIDWQSVLLVGGLLNWGTGERKNQNPIEVPLMEEPYSPKTILNTQEVVFIWPDPCP